MKPAIFLFTLLVAIAFPATANERDALKLLTIGNSFARDALGHLPAMAKAAGKELAVLGLNNGGYSLQRHVEGLRKAEKHNFRILPVGDAFYLARQTPRWTYADDPDFDYQNPPVAKDARPHEPNSLFIGWRWKYDATLEEDVFLLDAIHLNEPGRYLATCVWYLELFGADEIPEGTFDSVLDPGTTADLRRHALTAVEAHRESQHQPVAANP